MRLSGGKFELGKGFTELKHCRGGPFSFSIGERAISYTNFSMQYCSFGVGISDSTALIPTFPCSIAVLELV